MPSAVVLFVLHNGAAAWLAARWSRRLLPGAHGAERVLAGLVCFAGIVQVVLLATGLAGAFAAWPVAGVLAGLLVLDLALGRRAPDAAPPGADRPAPWPRPAIALTALAVLVSAWNVVATGTRFGFDILTYHAVAPAWWIRRGVLELTPFNYQSYYPMNAELHAGWFMLAPGTDAHASLPMLVWLGILVSAWVVHARRLGQVSWLAAAALACALLAPDMQERMPFFTSGDLAMACLLVGMLAFAWVPEGGRALPRALLAGLAGGLALGMKPTAAPQIAIAGVAFLLPRRAGGGASVVARGGVFALAVAATGGWWYVRNLWVTGNPLFPAQVGPFEGPFTKEVQYATTQLRILAESGWTEPETWRVFFSEHLDWPLPLGVLALAGGLGGLRATVREPDAARRAHLRLLLLCGVVFALLFPMQPFSGTVNRPDAGANYLVRYVTFPFVLGLLVLPSALPWRRRAAPATSDRRWSPRLVVAVVGALVLGLALSTPWRQGLADENLYAFREALERGWRAVDELPDGAHLAVYSMDPPSHVLTYPTFGRRLQHVPIPTEKDGTLRKPLHEHWREPGHEWWSRFDDDVRIPGDEVVANLRAAGVELVVLHSWPPPPEGMLERPFYFRRRLATTLHVRRCYHADVATEIWDLTGRFEGRVKGAIRGTGAYFRTPDR